MQIIGGVSSQRGSRFEWATWSLATFVRLHRSLRSLALQSSASLRSLCSLASFTGSLTHFAHSLVGRLKFLNMCSRCYHVSQEQTRFWRSLETRPKSLTSYPIDCSYKRRKSFVFVNFSADIMFVFVVPIYWGNSQFISIYASCW